MRHRARVNEQISLGEVLLELASKLLLALPRGLRLGLARAPLPVWRLRSSPS